MASKVMFKTNHSEVVVKGEVCKQRIAVDRDAGERQQRRGAPAHCAWALMRLCGNMRWGEAALKSNSVKPSSGSVRWVPRRQHCKRVSSTKCDGLGTSDTQIFNTGDA